MYKIHLSGLLFLTTTENQWINYSLRQQNYIWDMGESSDSFFENVLLKNIDEDIPINVDLSDTSDKYSSSAMGTLTISKTEKYMHKI